MVIPERKRKRKRTKSHFSLISPVIDWTIGYKQNTKKKNLKRQLKCSSIPCLLLVVPSVNKSVSISSIAQNVVLGVKLCVSCASVGCALNNCRSSFRVCFLSTKIVFFFLSPFLRAIHISNTVFLAGAKCRIYFTTINTFYFDFLSPSYVVY